jgi:2-iminobutanoate/2-iminopropanoate deaminase
MVFTSGYTGVDPTTGKVPPGIKEQTRIVLDHIRTVLEAANSSLDLVVKATVFLTSMRDYQDMNEVYRQYFPQVRPARSCVEVRGLTTPDKLIEIEVVAGTRG